MKIKITQDINKIETKDFWIFTKRQFIGLLLCAVITIPLYFLAYMLSGIDSALLFSFVVASPILYGVFIKKGNLPLEEVVKYYYLHMIFRERVREKKGGKNE